MITIEDFIRESNKIEGIIRYPLREEVIAHSTLLRLDTITIPDLNQFVETVTPGARLRKELGMDVRVGSHIPPRGGSGIEDRLGDLLQRKRRLDPQQAYRTHLEYEFLHPYIDGNGRSGRALWLWEMGGLSRAPLGFLHTFYYQTFRANS